MLELSEFVPGDISTVTCVVAGVIAATFVIIKLSQGPRLGAIPTFGSPTWLGSWWSGLKFFLNARKVIQEGFEQYQSAPFKIPTLFRWVVILSDRRYLDEIRNAPDDAFSFPETTDDDFKLTEMVGHTVKEHPIYLPVIRTQLTRNLNVLFPDIFDEIVTAFDEYLDLQGHEWKSVAPLGAVQKVICRASNRLFVGLPLCRNPDYIDLNINWAVDAITGGLTIRFFPKFLRGLAVRFLTKVPGTIDRNLNYLRPIIEERLRCLDTYGKEWADKPNDFLSWLMDTAQAEQRDPENLTRYLLVVNLGAIHTTSIIFTGALFALAAHPQYIQPLREEVESIIQEEGWSKDAVGKMYKMDSFFKECMRREGTDVLGMWRKALKDYTFADGLYIPKGTRLAAAARPLHYSEEYYPNPAEFDPFRFSNMRGEDKEDPKNQFTTTSPEYLGFGYGRHACPGRFFAANELKIMLAHVIMTYDVKLEDDTPWNLYISNLISINPKARLMLRKRVN